MFNMNLTVVAIKKIAESAEGPLSVRLIQNGVERVHFIDMDTMTEGFGRFEINSAVHRGRFARTVPVLKVDQNEFPIKTNYK